MLKTKNVWLESKQLEFEMNDSTEGRRLIIKELCDKEFNDEAMELWEGVCHECLGTGELITGRDDDIEIRKCPFCCDNECD